MHNMRRNVFWPAPEGITECKFFKIWDVSGKEITLSEGTEVKTVFFDDQRLVRLEVKEPVYNCQVDEVVVKQF